MKSKLYRNLKRRMIAITLGVSIAPLVLLGGVIYFQYVKVFEARIQDQVRHLASSQGNAVDVFLHERSTILSIIIDTYSFQELRNQEGLDRLFEMINRRADGLGLIDLGVIDAQGRHLSYAGPYNLKGLRYDQQPWFREVMSRGKYISDVYTGFRQLPHFIIAIRGHSSEGPWILRATIDSNIFNRLVCNAQAGQSGDAYIINSEGIYQTQPRFGGQVMDQAPLVPRLFGEGTNVLRRRNSDGSVEFVAGSRLNSKDWLLVVSQTGREQMGGLTQTRDTEVVIIVLGCLGIVITSVVTIRGIVARLESADQDLNELNAQLLQRDKMAALGKMAAGIAHEINNPLAVIGEKAGWMRDLLEEEEFQNSPNLREYINALDRIESHVERARKITHNMLGFARRMEPHREDVDINGVLMQTLELLQNHARINNIEIRQDFEPGLPIIASDQSQLQQVFLNLFNNAIDAIGKDGAIQCATCREKDEIVVIITDDGPGIAPENQRRIFDPFFTTKDPGKGTGLGLSISYQIIEKMGGRITIDNVEPHGTRVTVHLPAILPDKK
jgi:two-component system NtrC family sensor kinase